MIPATAEAILHELSAKDAPVLNLLALCRTPDYFRVWAEGPVLLRRFARLLLKQGHPTLALEVASRGLDKPYPDDQDLLYCRALALARCGNPTQAGWFVRDMLSRPDLAPAIRSDALSLAGRIQKDMALRASDLVEKTNHFRQAFEYYRQAHELSGDTFPGINAATLALVCGERERSRELAELVRNEELAKPDEGDYWRLATIAEASLLLGDHHAAREGYEQAVRLARENRDDGSIAAMLRQFRLLGDYLPGGADLLKLFRLGPVVVFAGHHLDKPGGPVRFPANPALEAAVREAIRNELAALETSIGYCVPGCGSEILFGELMREHSAELHLILPFAEEDFIRESVTFGLPENASWENRYQELKGFLRVTSHAATRENFLNDSVLYDFAGTFMQGLAITRAAQMGVEPVALVVRDSTFSAESGGLAAFISTWRKTGREPRVIELAPLRERLALGDSSPVSTARSAGKKTPGRTVKAMLFADVAGFSGLAESHLPAFFIQFLKLVEEELEITPAIFQNTWGDGLYVVFDDVLKAADFSLRLLKRFEQFDFDSFGFRLKPGREPGVRIGLHTGPVFEGWDAVMGKTNYFGSHVSRAARIEPVTAPGSAFVSEQFAAALAMIPNHPFVCEYLGLQPLAKEYDTCPLYRLTC
ncbi:TRAFs-binding domain-containing protein [Zavarzinella formosa]|uniref:TRAFs-binding domain-containing protein n=1 Tax=Zavarzinella formosa TaxID=360055 RepID=UPI0002F4498D|nr:TRAFs-binding domain-containing protein [Zavarzinella formosa]